MPKSAHKAKVYPKWKKYQSKNKVQSQVKFGLVALLFLLALVLAGKLFEFLGSLNKPLSSNGTSALTRNLGWDGVSTLNLAVRADKVYLLSFNPQKEAIFIVEVPDETYLTLPLGFGRWPVSSVYGLGEAEKPPVGGVLLRETLSASFGIPVNSYIVIEGQKRERPFREVLEAVKKSPFEGLDLIRQSKTDLNIMEYGKLWWGIRGVRFDKVQSVDLGQVPITTWFLLPDESRSLALDEAKFDLFIQGKLEDSKLKEEGFSVGIYNATEHFQLAEQAARMVANMGGRVIFTANSPRPLSESLVLGAPSYSQNYLRRLFAPHCQGGGGLLGFGQQREGGCQTEGGEFETARADIQIVLGEDYYLRYNTK